jgi:hypothetical protein
VPIFAILSAMSSTARLLILKCASRWISVGVLTCVSSAGLAVPSLSTSLPPLSSDQTLDELNVNVSEQLFLDRSNAPVSNKESNRLSTRVKTGNQTRPVSGFLEAGASFDTAVDKQTSFEVPEAFLTWAREYSADDPPPSADEPTPFGFQLDVGRKLEEWSHLDADWTLGIWQPLNRFDSLRPSEQGLTGAFLNFMWENAELVLFGSPLYLPEQGPSYEIENGKFTTNNAWFAPPAQDVVLVSKGTPLRYKLETPTVGSVIRHASIGGLMRFGDFANPGVRVQASYAYKPRNQLSLPFSGMLIIDSQNPEASVTVYPQVAYHHVAALELSHRANIINVSLSALADIAEPENLPSNLVWQKFDPLFLLSPTIEFRVGQFESYTPIMKLSSLHSFGGETTLFGGAGAAGGKPDQNPFGSRLLYRQAASAELRGRFHRRGVWKAEHGLRWIEEFAEQGSVLMTDVRVAYRENWQLAVYCDLLASRQPEQLNPGFISRFRANDRFGAQLTYVF